MIVVVTGMVGLEKKAYLQKVCDLAAKNGKEVVLCNVGDMMYGEARDITAGKILDIPMKRLSSLRRSIFKDIITKACKAQNLIVNTHATFRWRHGLFPAVDFDQMRVLAADMYINLVDGVADLYARLANKDVIPNSLKDLLVWREEEIIATEMLCKGIDDKTPFYCLARGQETETVNTFYQLVFEPGQKRCYLSFPMTHVSNDKRVKNSILEFRKAMHELFTCFDPGDLEESDLPLKAKEAVRKGQDSVETLALGKKIRLNAQECIQIELDISSQIYTRDFMLIDQADMIISYIPARFDGKAIISSGVERELQHAHEAAKEVYIIWTANHSPSVFVTQTATKVFSDVASCVEFFKKKGMVSEPDGR